MLKKTSPLSSSSSSSFFHHNHYHNHDHHDHNNHHIFLAPPVPTLLKGHLGWRKHITITIVTIKIIMIIIVIVIILIVIAFLPPSGADYIWGSLGGWSATFSPLGWSHFNLNLTSKSEGVLLSKEYVEVSDPGFIWNYKINEVSLHGNVLIPFLNNLS